MIAFPPFHSAFTSQHTGIEPLTRNAPDTYQSPHESSKIIRHDARSARPRDKTCSTGWRYQRIQSAFHGHRSWNPHPLCTDNHFHGRMHSLPAKKIAQMLSRSSRASQSQSMMDASRPDAWCEDAPFNCRLVGSPPAFPPSRFAAMAVISASGSHISRAVVVLDNGERGAALRPLLLP